MQDQILGSHRGFAYPIVHKGKVQQVKVHQGKAHKAKAPKVALAGILFALLATIGAPQPAVAEEERILEEIIVTGTKRNTSQQDTPIAISTITANDIGKTFGNDIRAIGDLSPNVNLTLQTGFNALAGGIRGTGSISILTTQDPSVGILIDEFALSHVQTQFVELFDLEQVEIYRGPQGTLFGKNSTGGVISITSKRPDLEEYGADVRLVGGGYTGGAQTGKAQVGIDIPLIEGKLGLRFAGSLTKEEGFYTNDKDTAVFPNAPILAAFGLDPANPNLPPELDTRTRGDGSRLGGKDVAAAKTKLLWQPNDRYEAYFLWELVRDRSDSPPGVNETPGGEGFLFDALGFPGIQTAGHSDPFSTGQTQQGAGINMRDGHQVDIDGFYLNQRLDFDKFSIKSITGYREQEETLPSTYTGEAFLSLFDATRNLEREQFQQEFRIVSNLDGPLNFVAGGIYNSDDLDFRSYATVGLSSIIPSFNADTGSFLDARGFTNLDLRGITGDPNNGQVKQDRESLAFYLDGTYDITDQFSLTLGIRHTKDEKEFYKPTGPGAPCTQFTEALDAVLADAALPFDPATNCVADLRSNAVSRAGITGDQIDPRRSALPASQYGFIADDKEEWSETTWRVVLDYKTNEDTLMYLSVATGFLAGGYSETCSQLVTCLSFDPETNTNYEIGIKTDLLDSRLRLNAAFFYTEFEDLQRNQVFAFTQQNGDPGQETITLNAGESHAMGLELEATWIINENFSLKTSFGWLDAEYDKFEFDTDPTDAIPALDLTSLSVPFAAEYQFGLEGNYDVSLSNGGNIQVTAGLHYQDEAETSPFDPNAAAAGVARHPTNTQMEDRTLVNANITYFSPDERYHLTLFGKNLTNEEYRVSANSVGALWNFTQYGAPRQWGLELGFNLQ